MVHTLFNDRAHEVIDWLFLSGMPGANWDLAGMGFGLVVTLSANVPVMSGDKQGLGEAHGQGRVVYVHWPIEDGDVPDVVTAQVVVNVVRDILHQGRRVLVHCQAGANRSALLVALVVRDEMRVSGAEAARLVMDARLGTLRNSDFLSYLEGLPIPGS